MHGFTYTHIREPRICKIFLRISLASERKSERERARFPHIIAKISRALHEQRGNQKPCANIIGIQAVRSQNKHLGGVQGGGEGRSGREAEIEKITRSRYFQTFQRLGDDDPAIPYHASDPPPTSPGFPPLPSQGSPFNPPPSSFPLLNHQVPSQSSLFSREPFPFPPSRISCRDLILQAEAHRKNFSQENLFSHTKNL